MVRNYPQQRLTFEVGVVQRFFRLEFNEEFPLLSAHDRRINTTVIGMPRQVPLISIPVTTR